MAEVGEQEHKQDKGAGAVVLGGNCKQGMGVELLEKGMAVVDKGHRKEVGDYCYS